MMSSGDRDATRPAVGDRQRVFLDLQRVGIDPDDLVRPKSQTNGTPLVVNTMPYGFARSSASADFDLSGLRVRRPTEFAFCAVKNSMPFGAKSGVCGSRTSSGSLYSDDVARLRIELADVAFRVRREPQIAVFVEFEAMTSRRSVFWAETP